MRTYAIVFFSILFVFNVNAQKKFRKVVNKPYFMVTSHSKLEIEKVTLTPDTTFLDIMIYGIPFEEVNIDSTSVLRCGDKSYLLLGRENLAPQGEWVKLSAEGARSARIKFEPLPLDAELFDFKEETRGGWQILGIRLDGKKPEVSIPEELKNQQLSVADSYPPLDVRFGKSIIHGRLLGYTPGMVRVSVVNSSWISDNVMPAEIFVNPDGTFTVENYSASSVSTTLHIGAGNIGGIFLLPGCEMEITVDLPSFIMANSRVLKKEYEGVPCVWFSGDYAALNTELYANRHQRSIINKEFFSDICGMTPLKYKSHCFKEWEKRRSKITKNKQISDVARNMLLIDLEMSLFNGITGYKSNLSYAPMISGKKGIKRADMTIDDTYYNEILKLDFINKPECMLSSSFKSYVRGGLELFQDKIQPQQPLWQDIVLAGKLSRQLGHFHPLDDKSRATADSIQTQEIRKGIDFMDNRIRIKLEEQARKTGYTVLELDSTVTNQQLIASMVAPYKGNVVFVDFWATWCGPCIRAMKETEPLREKYFSRNIKFLYVTGETSPEKTWKMTIPDIKGDHYRLADEQWNYIMTTYEIPGIPAYFIINRNGEIVYKTVSFPGVEKLEEEFEKALAN